MALPTPETVHQGKEGAMKMTPHRRQVSQGRSPVKGTLVGREVRSGSHPPARPEKSLRRKLWFTSGGRVRGTGAGSLLDGRAGPSYYLRQPTASRAFPSAATDSLQAPKPRLVLTATSLPISSFGVWPKNVPRHRSREDFQVFSPAAAQSLLPKYYRHWVTSAGPVWVSRATPVQHWDHVSSSPIVPPP